MAVGVLMALMLAQAAVPAAAEPAKAEAVKPETVAAKPEKPKKVCVQETQLGSHFKTRICATPEEWERRRERDAEVLSRGSDRPTKPD